MKIKKKKTTQRRALKKFNRGLEELAEWLGHFANMLAYDALHHALGKPLRDFADRRAGLFPGDKLAFRARRLADAWEYGSGMDYGH